jgi:hypothetical protein
LTPQPITCRVLKSEKNIAPMTRQNQRLPEPFAQLNTLLEQGGAWWQGPAAYWQTVASIMNLRSQALQSTLSLGVDTWQNILKSQSWPEAVKIMTAAQGQAWCQGVNLNAFTTQQRALLLQQLRLLASRGASEIPQPGTTSAGATSRPAEPQAKGTEAQAKTQLAAAPSSQPPVYLKGTFYPAKPPITAPQTAANGNQAGGQGEGEPKPAAINQTTNKEVVAPLVSPTQAEVKVNPQAMPIVSPPAVGMEGATGGDGTNLFQLGLPRTVSVTGENSVMRSSSGAAIGASAATRRSVIARRNQRKNRLVRAR